MAILALLWNLLGCVFFLTELFAQEAMMESMTVAQKEWARSIPRWIYFVYGAAVLTGVVGSIGLIARKSWAIPAFAVSFGAVVLQMGYAMIIHGGLKVMGPSGAIMPSIVTCIAAGLLWFAWLSRRRLCHRESREEVSGK